MRKDRLIHVNSDPKCFESTIRSPIWETELDMSSDSVRDPHSSGSFCSGGCVPLSSEALRLILEI
jgi:hypothetical protein